MYVCDNKFEIRTFHVLMHKLDSAIGLWAMSAMMVSRFICGMGGAGKTLAYSYVASVVPQGKILGNGMGY